MTKEDKESQRFYDVERAARVIEETRVKRSLPFHVRLLRKLRDLASPIIVTPLLYLSIFAVGFIPIVGVMFGVLAFLAALAALLASVGYIVHRIAGEHLVFADRPMKTRLLALPIAFLLAAALILGLIFIPRLLRGFFA